MQAPRELNSGLFMRVRGLFTEGMDQTTNRVVVLGPRSLNGACEENDVRVDLSSVSS
jgi:hypothetical protein